MALSFDTVLIALERQNAPQTDPTTDQKSTQQRIRKNMDVWGGTCGPVALAHKQNSREKRYQKKRVSLVALLNDNSHLRKAKASHALSVTLPLSSNLQVLPSCFLPFFFSSLLPFFRSPRGKFYLPHYLPSPPKGVVSVLKYVDTGLFVFVSLLRY